MKKNGRRNNRPPERSGDLDGAAELILAFLIETYIAKKLTVKQFRSAGLAMMALGAGMVLYALVNARKSAAHRD